MLQRDEAAARMVAATAAFFAMVFGFVPVFLTAISCFGAETGVVAFADFLTVFLAVFFVAGFFAAFFVFFAFLAILFVFFAAILVFFARFFDAAVLAARCDTFAFFFFEGFLPATTNSLITARR